MRDGVGCGGAIASDDASCDGIVIGPSIGSGLRGCGELPMDGALVIAIGAGTDCAVVVTTIADCEGVAYGSIGNMSPDGPLATLDGPVASARGSGELAMGDRWSGRPGAGMFDGAGVAELARDGATSQRPAA